MDQNKTFPGNAKKNYRNSADEKNTQKLRNKRVERVSMDGNI